MLRLAIGLPILLLLGHKSSDEQKKLDVKDYLALFLQALTGIVLFNVLLLYALHYTTATNSGIITSMTPAVIAALSWVFLREHLSIRAGGGILLTVGGVLAINVVGSDAPTSRGPAPLVGNLLVFGAVIGEALFTVFRRFTAGRVSSLHSATLVTRFALVIFAPVGIYQACSLDFSRVSLKDLLLLLYYGVGVTALAYILWFSGVEKVPASTAAVFTGVLPVITIMLSALFPGEQSTTAHLVGLVCVPSGIGLITRNAS